MKEEALLFGKTSSLVGIITDPPETKRDKNLPAIVLLNAGVIHRVGPHRQFVKMARTLAEMGFVVLRFDFSGIGDSTVRGDNLPFEKSAVSETQEAMNRLNTKRGTKQFVLIGLCSGGVISFKTACCDPRVVGAVLLNSVWCYQHEISNEMISYVVNRNAARNYRETRLFNAKSWLRIIKGKANYWLIMKAMGFLLRNPFARKKKVFPGADYVVADIRLMVERGVDLLFVYSENAPELDLLQVSLGDEMQVLSLYGKFRVEILQQTDHTFTLLQHQEGLINIVRNWTHVLFQDSFCEHRLTV